MQAIYRNLKSHSVSIVAFGITLLGVALTSAQQTIPFADSPVYLLAGKRPINPGESTYKMVSWEKALAHVDCTSDVIDKLRQIEGLPFFGEARFRMALESIGVDTKYAETYASIKKYAISHPHPNSRLADTTTDPNTGVATSKFRTGTSIFRKPEKYDAFTKPPGTNMLPTVYTNMFDGYGKEMFNTLPSTKQIPYNLHDGYPEVSEIDQTSPTDDLRDIYHQLLAKTALALKPPSREQPVDAKIRLKSIRTLAQKAIDILEGNPIHDRAYSGFPLLHYDGPNKIKHVTPIKDADGKTIGGNVDIHQLWYDAHIESDTALLNAADVWDVCWTITYTVDVMSRGHDDFAPFALFTDDPKINNNKGNDFKPPPSAVGKSPADWPIQKGGLPHFGLDQSFYPMEDGTRTIFRIKMPPGKYFHLIYTWGWRMHPPRIQSTDRATKCFRDPETGEEKTLVKWETDVFGVNPKWGDAEAKMNAINMLGDLSPAKRMWHIFREGRDIVDRAKPNAPDYMAEVKRMMRLLQGVEGDRSFTTDYAQTAYFDWRNRGIMRLPKLYGTARTAANDILGRSMLVDPKTDLTLLYANNTIYGEFSDRGVTDYPSWKLRAKRDEMDPTIKITIFNADYFPHAYVNVDFGGSRGWENQFKSSVQTGGSGCWFTFGRSTWWPNNKPVTIPAADRKNVESVFKNARYVNFTYNYEPSRRLRFYQFDPTHHDVAILSIH